MKRFVLAILAVFIIWSLLDFLIHGLILKDAYKATSELWRTMEEMKLNLLRFVVLIKSIVFVSIYTLFFAKKGVRTALLYGLLFGIGIGIPMGYGGFAVMPIPYKIAFVWFHGTLVETILGSLLIGLIIKK